MNALQPTVSAGSSTKTISLRTACPSARTQRVPLAGGDQIQRLALRRVRKETFAREKTPQGGGQRLTGPHRIDTGFRWCVPLDCGDIAGGEDIGVGGRLQGLSHPDEPFRIQAQTSIREPAGWGGAGGPEHFVEGKRAVAVDQHGV